MKKFLTCMIWFCLSLILLTGCGKDEELEAYQQEMSAFFTDIGELNEKINAIDPEADNSTAELLSYLDTLKTEFENLAALEVPEEFESVTSLADEAGSYMAQAVDLYHEAYEAETPDKSVLDTAFAYYSRANVRLQYIVSILHGEIPSGENVTVSMDNHSIFDKEEDSPSEASSGTE